MEEMRRLGRSEFVAVYDCCGDVLYVNDGKPRIATTRADADGFIWRYEKNTNKIIGLTIEDFRLLWSGHVAELASRLRRSMPIESSEAVEIAKDMLASTGGSEDHF